MGLKNILGLVPDIPKNGRFIRILREALPQAQLQLPFDHYDQINENTDRRFKTYAKNLWALR